MKPGLAGFASSAGSLRGARLGREECAMEYRSEPFLHGGNVVKFDVRGKEFSLSLDLLREHPDSYVTWVVQNSPELVRRGEPIPINRRPDAFKKLLKKISEPPAQQRMDPEGVNFGGHSRSEIALDLHKNFPGGPSITPPPPRPSGRSMTQSHLRHPHYQFHRAKNPYEAFNVPQPYRKNPSISSASTHHQLEFDSPHSGDTDARTATNRTMAITASKGTDEVVQDAVEEIVSMLRRCTHNQQRFDKALVVLTWGRDGQGSRSLRPRISKLYESMTGRVHDVRRSSDGGSSSFDKSATTGWGEFDSLFSATCISTRVQSLVVENLRSAGFAASFSEVKLDKNGLVDWRGRRHDTHVMNDVGSSSVRCLVVHLR